MGFFGNDKEVQKITAEAYRDLLGMQQERDHAIAAWRHEQQVRVRVEQEFAKARAEVKRLRTQVEDQAEREEDLVGRVRMLVATKKKLAGEVQRLQEQVERLKISEASLAAQLKREEDRASAKIALAERQRLDAVANASDLDDRVDELERENHALDRRAAELEGLAKGWAPIVAGVVGQVASSEESETKGKQGALREQAALARAHKQDVGPEAKLRLLEEADRLGVLSPKLRGELKALRGS